MEAARNDLEITTGQVSDADVLRIFNSVDADGSGSVGAGEFITWLNAHSFSPSFNSDREPTWFEQLVFRFVSAASRQVREFFVE